MAHTKTHRRKYSKKGHKSRKHIKRGGFWPFDSTQSTSYPSMNNETSYSLPSNPLSQLTKSFGAVLAPGISIADRVKQAGYATFGVGSPVGTSSMTEAGPTISNPLLQNSVLPTDTTNPMHTGGRRYRRKGRSHKKTHRRKH
jgi:hypothetical protein